MEAATTEIIEASEPEVTGSDLAPIRYNVTDAAIAKLKTDYMALSVSGVDDKEGYELCHKARMVVRNKRVEVEKHRKKLKADSLEYGRKVDAEAKRITAQLEEIEDYLQAQQRVVDDEKKRLAEEAAKAAKEKLDARIEALQEVKAVFNIQAVESLSDADFRRLLETETSRFLAEEKVRREEQARLAKLEEEQREKDRKIAEQQAELDRLKAEQLEQQKAALKKAEEETAAAEARNREAERKLKEEREARERDAKAAQEAKEAAEREREAQDKARLAAEAEKARKEEEEAQAKAEAERKAKEAAEAEAARQIADAALYEEIKAAFPTLESAWVEIARLRKETDTLDEFRQREPGIDEVVF